MVELQEVQRLLDLLTSFPPAGVYAIIAAGSAVENVFPPVPSDTFVVLGGVLADRGGLRPLVVLLLAWLANVAGAMVVYALARRRGPGFFQDGWGRRALRPHQFDRVADFYESYGLWAIFFSRFLPVLRVVIPTFAGFAHLGVFRTLIPVAGASLLWNAVVLYAGIFASRNVGWILELLGSVNAWLLGVALVVFAAILWWWVRTRRPERAEARQEEEARRKADPDWASDLAEEAREAAEARREREEVRRH